jgi:hypothetical protein
MKERLRTRWAAIGAAVAVTLGAGGFGLANAAVSSGERPVFVAITPCRLLDTRAGSVVPTRQTPLGPGETYTQSAHGNNGLCSGIPADATALSLNVTAINATVAGTFLTFWPTGASRPDASSLNPAPGQPPTPNAVITDISPAGQFDIYNFSGNVDLLVDMNGYYVDHNHDDRYYTKPQVDAAVGTKANAADVYTKAQIDQRIPKVDYVSIPSSAFRGIDDGVDLYTTDGGVWVGPSSASATLVAPVSLPDRANITQVVAHFWDESSGDLGIELWCARNSNPSNDTIVATLVTSGNSASWRPAEMALTSNTKINNTDCSYELRANALAPPNDWADYDDELRIRAVVVRYEMPA